MSDPSFPRTGRSRLGELALWTTAAVLTVGVHAGAAYYLMQEQPEPVADAGPPAAIMIELAALPEAVNTEETVEANDVEDVQEVKSVVPDKVEDVPPPVEPPQPQPEPVVEETPPEPEPTPEPPQEITEPLPEPLPEPVEEIDTVQEQQMAALENVEVPLPSFRPPLPPVEKKVEKKDEPEKKKVERKKTVAPAASAAKDTAKVETTQSDRTAASKNSSGLFSSSVSPAKWNARVRSAVSRRVSRAGSKGMSVTVAFNVDDGGSIGRVRVISSTGDAAIDGKVVNSIEKASVAEPPPGAQTAFQVKIDIQ
ncbi:energy transducer TonB [Agrobacterium rosae]|uniref:energy transducer TonB family protein n=1 Tax=Agrobacterium rosae TaxID=1972867 RepID=UPI002A14452D|nr:energy transducer TonB [Agrobacterium rosae]MDX8314921.1 energy transducer TonB [Agrobacterium rosae]